MKSSLVAMGGILIILMVSLTFLVGCSGQAATSSSPATSVAPAPATSAAPKTSTAPAAPATSTAPAPSSAAQKVIELKFTDQYTSNQVDGKVDEMLGKLIEDNTGGQVKVTYYHAEGLGKVPDFINLVNGGVADIANCTPGNYPTNFAFISGLEIPMLGFPDRASRMSATWELFNAGYFNKELDPFKVLALNATGAMNTFTKKYPKTVDEMKGLKIRASDANMRKWLENLGATPVAMSSADVYMALDRGTIDGVYTAAENYLQNKFYEVIKNAQWNPISIGCMIVIMNKNTWNNLPPDVQAGVNKAIEAFKKAYLDFRAGDDANAVTLLKNQGVNVYTFTGDDVNKLAAAAAPIKNDWITAMQAKGLSAKEMFAALDKITAKK